VFLPSSYTCSFRKRLTMTVLLEYLDLWLGEGGMASLVPPAPLPMHHIVLQENMHVVPSQFIETVLSVLQ